MRLQDGASVKLTKKNNLEVEFAKSNRWQGRDQIKVAFEEGVNGQGGALGPVVEHWGYWVFANQPESRGVTPMNEFWRVDVAGQQTQGLVVGLYCSASMDAAGRGSNGDIWKRGFYHGYFTNKVTNFDERVLGLQEMIERLRTVAVGGPLADLEQVAGVRADSWVSFLTGNLLVSNWDGYMNNYFLHHAVGGDGLVGTSDLPLLVIYGSILTYFL